MHDIGDFERISDHAVNLKEAAEELEKKKLVFSDKASEELSVFEEAVKDIINTSLKVFKEEDLLLARKVEPLEEVIDFLHTEDEFDTHEYLDVLKEGGNPEFGDEVRILREKYVLP